MPIYEYICPVHDRFESLRSMSEYKKPSDCPECGKESGRVVSSSYSREAQPFRVVDSEGNITQEKQVLNNTPEYNDSSVQPKEVDTTKDVKRPIITRGGGVYHPKGVLSNAT